MTDHSVLNCHNCDGHDQCDAHLSGNQPEPGECSTFVMVGPAVPCEFKGCHEPATQAIARICSEDEAVVRVLCDEHGQGWIDSFAPGLHYAGKPFDQVLEDKCEGAEWEYK